MSNAGMWLLLVVFVMAVEPHFFFIPVFRHVPKAPDPVVVIMSGTMRCDLKTPFCFSGTYNLLHHTKGKVSAGKTLGLVPYHCFSHQHATHIINFSLLENVDVIDSRYFKISLTAQHNCSTSGEWREIKLKFKEMNVKECMIKYEYSAEISHRGSVIFNEAQYFERVEQAVPLKNDDDY